MTPPAISLTDVRLTYPDGTRALDGVTFSVAKGERVCLLGPNGAGKTTLLHAILGFVVPEEGRIEVEGVPVSPRTLGLVRQRVGLVFQDPDDQLFCPTLLEDVCFGPRHLGLVGPGLEDRAREALDAVGLWNLRDRHPSRLSLGQKRRAALATVLSMGPEVLLLDEPSASLDGPSRRSLRSFLARVQATLVVATQDVAFVADLCTRALVMAAGKIVWEGSLEDLITEPAHVEEWGIPVLSLCPRCGRASRGSSHDASP